MFFVSGMETHVYYDLLLEWFELKGKWDEAGTLGHSLLVFLLGYVMIISSQMLISSLPSPCILNACLLLEGMLC